VEYLFVVENIGFSGTFTVTLVNTTIQITGVRVSSKLVSM